MVVIHQRLRRAEAQRLNGPGPGASR